MLKLLGKVMFLCIILTPQLKASQSFISRTQLASTLTAEQKNSRPGSGTQPTKKMRHSPSTKDMRNSVCILGSPGK